MCNHVYMLVVLISIPLFDLHGGKAPQIGLLGTPTGIRPASNSSSLLELHTNNLTFTTAARTETTSHAIRSKTEICFLVLILWQKCRFKDFDFM